MDVDECSNGLHQCHATLAVCTNNYGNYTCECVTGYEGDGVTCADMDECAHPSTHRCDVRVVDVFGSTNGACANLAGSYSCSCNAGFYGSGWDGDCTNVNDCASQPCDHGGRCIDGADAYQCVCPAHYSGPQCEASEGLSGAGYLTIAIVVGAGALAALFLALQVHVRKRRSALTVLEDKLEFEEWMKDEHHRRGKSAAVGTRKTLAERERNKKRRKVLAEGERGIAKEAKMASGIFSLWGAPSGLDGGQSADPWMRSVEKREFEAPAGAVLLEDDVVLAGGSKPSTPPGWPEGSFSEPVSAPLALGNGGGAGMELALVNTPDSAELELDAEELAPTDTALTDELAVVASLDQGTRARAHLHGTMSAHVQELDQMRSFAQALRRMEVEADRRHGQDDGLRASTSGTAWGEGNASAGGAVPRIAQKTPITISYGGRMLHSDGRQTLKRDDAAQNQSRRSMAASVAARVSRGTGAKP